MSGVKNLALKKDKARIRDRKNILKNDIID